MGIKFKYTAPSTPKQNGCIELKFVTLFNWVHTMDKGGKFSSFFRNGLWAEAANTATLLENNLVTPNRDASPFQQFLGNRKRKKLVK